MWEFHFQPYNCNCHVLLSSLLEEPKRLDHLQRVELDEIEGHHFYFVSILHPVKKKEYLNRTFKVVVLLKYNILFYDVNLSKLEL